MSFSSCSYYSKKLKQQWGITKATVNSRPASAYVRESIKLSFSVTVHSKSELLLGLSAPSKDVGSKTDDLHLLGKRINHKKVDA